MSGNYILNVTCSGHDLVHSAVDGIVHGIVYGIVHGVVLTGAVLKVLKFRTSLLLNGFDKFIYSCFISVCFILLKFSSCLLLYRS